MTDTWKRIWMTSKYNHIIDHNFLIAHDRLPLGNWLLRTGINNDDRCRLCNNATETREHLYVKCERVQVQKTVVENMIATILGQALFKLGEKEILYHEGAISAPKHSRRSSEVLSIYKHAIWKTRGAVISNGQNLHVEDILEAILQADLKNDREIGKILNNSRA